MKEFNIQTGGFPFFPGTDLTALQTLFKAGLEDQFKDVGNVVLQGLVVGGTQAAATVTAGLVYIGGRICVFDAVASVNLTSPWYIAAKTVANSNRNYGVAGVAGSKIAYSDYKAELVSVDPGASNRIILDWTNKVNKRIIRNAFDSQSFADLAAQVSSASYSITSATNTWQNTGLNFTIPSAGLYNIFYSADCILGSDLSSNEKYIRARVFDVLTSGVLVSSSKIGAYYQDSVSETKTKAGSIAFSSCLYFSSARQLRLEALRFGSSFSFSTLDNVLFGYNKLS